jgi:hypothetical protein
MADPFETGFRVTLGVMAAAGIVVALIGLGMGVAAMGEWILRQREIRRVQKRAAKLDAEVMEHLEHIRSAPAARVPGPIGVVDRD